MTADSVAKQAETQSPAHESTESAAFKQTVLDCIPCSIAVLDHDGVIIAVNRPWRRFALEMGGEPGKPAPHSAVGTDYLALCAPGPGVAMDGTEAARDGIQAVLDRRLPSFSMDYPCHSAKQQRWFSMTVMPLTPDDGGVVVAHSDITEREQFAAALQASESKYRALMEHAAEAVVLCDMQGIVLEINAAAEMLLGFERSELVGNNISMIHPAAEMPRIAAAFAQFERMDRIETVDCHVLTKPGQQVPVGISSVAIRVAGRRVVMGIFRDLSEKQRIEARRLKDESALRDALVREVHHRIKNSLQGVTGILRGMAQRQPALRAEVDDVIGQVGSIAVVHGLYGSASGSRVSLFDLVADVARNTESLWRMEIIVAVEHKCRHCIIDEAEAVPLALVLNELLSNACKHGAAADASDQCTVAIEYAADCSQASVRIRNTGHLPPDFDFARRQGLGTGLLLVAALLPKDGASIEWTQDRDSVITRLSLSAPIFAEEVAVAGLAA